MLDQEKICLSCQADDTWKMHAEQPGRFPSGTICKNCEEERTLNDEGLCKECYRTIHSFPKLHCLRCENVFYSGHPTELLCDNCKYTCEGCGAKYNPSSRDEVLCSACNFKGQRGQGNCSKCGDYSNELDGMARCHKCSEDHYDMIDSRVSQNRWCKSCEHNLAVPYGVFCKECKHKKYTCPVCLKNEISVTQFTCTGCELKRTNEWKNRLTFKN